MGYRRLGLSTQPPTIPDPAMVPLEPLEPTGPHVAMRALDTLPSSTRVLDEFGFAGSLAFLVWDGVNPTYDDSSRLYPDNSTPRVVVRKYGVPLTPGHVVGIDVVALPSGPTQQEPETGDYEESGRGGTVDIQVIYRNRDGQSVVATASISPPPSVQVYGAIPASAMHAMTTHTATAYPWAGLPSAVDLEKWTRGGDVTVEYVVSYTGSPRVLDGAVVERPAQIVVDTASPTWPAAMYTGNGAPYPTLPSDYPITQLTSSDPGGGLEGLRRAVEQAGVQLGPCLMWWTSATEGADTLGDWVSYDGGSGDDEAPAATVTTNAYRNLPFTTAPVLAELPGYQLGGYARQATASNDWLDGRTGVLPVYFVAYANAFSGVVQARAGTTEWSAVNLDFSGSTWGWEITAGWIEVGTCPEDGPVGRFFAKGATDPDQVHVRYAGVFFRPR